MLLLLLLLLLLLFLQWEGGAKRKGRLGGTPHSDDEGGEEAPSNDVYRKRMHKKIK